MAVGLTLGLYNCFFYHDGKHTVSNIRKCTPCAVKSAVPADHYKHTFEWHIYDRRKCQAEARFMGAHRPRSVMRVHRIRGVRRVHRVRGVARVHRASGVWILLHRFRGDM